MIYSLINELLIWKHFLKRPQHFSDIDFIFSILTPVPQKTALQRGTEKHANVNANTVVKEKDGPLAAS